MGSKVIFTRAPRGDAVQAPPPVGASSQLGTSDRAAREDHTHEGVHRVMAGSGIGITPGSGLGDVTVETLHWRPPVQSFADLPASGNQPGDARVVIGEGAIYVWTGGGWTKISGEGGGSGGSGGGFVLDERLNHLRGQIRMSQLHGASRFDLYSEFVDDFNDLSGIDQEASFGGYTTVSSRLQLQGSQVWQQKYPASSPPPLQGHALAFDKQRGVVVLFGGRITGSFGSEIAETWEWDGTTWTKKQPATSPPARAFHAMVYDEARGVVLLFGGLRTIGTLVVFNDTWIYDGVTWTQLTPQTQPPARYSHDMAYDSKRGVVVLFGGHTGSNQLRDTWEWNGNNWVQISPSIMPSARYGHKMAFDPNRGVTVLFGGLTGATRNQDTWEYNGVNWTQRSPATIPSARNAHAMVFDPTRSRVVLFGGYTNEPLNDTWEYDGNTWTQITTPTTPAIRYSHAMAWDDARKEVVLYGGYKNTPSPVTVYGDTWGYAKYGQATVVLSPLALPWVPKRAYLTAKGIGGMFSVSRDGGATWAPILPDSEVDLSAQPPGSLLTAKIEITGNEYVDAIGVGASNI